ncbi:MAG TPA: glycosyltransferase family 4 protein [Tepidisphaeraceae bacterium]|nr:glycosyltransferase family 4 protein [Tepidisphaeraceae bacterium]
MIILHADAARGGAERYTIDLAQGLARRGHEVTIVAQTSAGRPAGVEVVELPPARSAVSRTAKYDDFCRQVEGHVAGRAYDVVHAMLPVSACDVYHPHAGVAADAIATGHRKHASKWRRLLAKVFSRWSRRRRRFAQVERQLLAGAGRRPVTICLSEYVARSVRKHYELADEDLATLFNSVDLGKYDPAARPGERRDYRKGLGVTDDAPVALIVAQDFARKGVREAIEALAQVVGRHTGPAGERPMLLVVGRDAASPYRRVAGRLGVAHRVRFAGGANDVYPAYAGADYFVLPTRHDPCSLVVLEALAMGLPVVSTRQNGACEIMTPGQHGFVLDSAADVRGLATAMTALADPDTRLLMSNACLALRPRLSYDTHLETVEGIYARAIARRG